MTEVQLKPAAHRQTRYRAAPRLDPPEVLPIPAVTGDLQRAIDDLSTHGVCLLEGALNQDEMEHLRKRVGVQAAAERALGDQAPPDATAVQQPLSNLVNKGQHYLDLVLREEVDELAGFMLGKDFLISSITAGIFHGSTSKPQQLHRDQGQVPATADFPAACNLFWLLDDFTPERGSTWVVPGSHRWPAEFQIEAPQRNAASQITAPAGTLFGFDGRIWHGYGANREGHPRRHVACFLCLPWMRQQENWGVTCLQEVLDSASPKLRRRLGLRTYGTLGLMSGTSSGAPVQSLGNYDVEVPEFIIGENGTLHPMLRVGRSQPGSAVDKG